MEVIEAYFKSKNWHFKQVADKRTFILVFEGKQGSFQAILNVLSNNFLTFYSIFGTDTPENRKMEILKLINLINNDMLLGNFEMNPASGEIRCKTNFSLANIQLSESLLDELVMLNIITMDRFIPSITQVVFEDITAVEAFKSAQPQSKQP